MGKNPKPTVQFPFTNLLSTYFGLKCQLFCDEMENCFLIMAQLRF